MWVALALLSAIFLPVCSVPALCSYDRCVPWHFVSRPRSLPLANCWSQAPPLAGFFTRLISWNFRLTNHHCTVDGRNPDNQLRKGSLSRYLPGFLPPRWCRISDINSIWMIRKGSNHSASVNHCSGKEKGNSYISLKKYRGIAFVWRGPLTYRGLQMHWWCRFWKLSYHQI